MTTMLPIYDPATGEISRYAPARVVVCRTEGCENEGVEIEVSDDGSTVICGPCGQVITPAGQQPA